MHGNLTPSIELRYSFHPQLHSAQAQTHVNDCKNFPSLVLNYSFNIYRKRIFQFKQVVPFVGPLEPSTPRKYTIEYCTYHGMWRTSFSGKMRAKYSEWMAFRPLHSLHLFANIRVTRLSIDLNPISPSCELNFEIAQVVRYVKLHI